MSVSLSLVIVVGVLMAGGVTLVLERSLTRILVGLILIGNALNILFVIAAGPPGRAPIVGAGTGPMSDPLPQALTLTAIVITLGTTSFGLALAYRASRITGHDEVQDDVEDRQIRRRALADQQSELADPLTEGLPEEEGADR
ncbi:Na(+)/H(+) antiporter subunit C [Actinomycetota bacterium]